MADETRTTQYLFEFAASGARETTEQFAQIDSQLARYEQSIGRRMANIERLLRGAGAGAGAAPPVVMPTIDTTQIQQAEQAINQAQVAMQNFQTTASQATTTPVAGGEKLLYEAEAIRDGTQVMSEYRKELGGLGGAVERSKTTFDAYGNEIENVTEHTWKTADGVRRLHREIQTDATPGVAQVKSFSEELEQGTVRVETMETALNDTAGTVIRTRDVFDQAGEGVARFTTTTWTAADGMRRVRNEQQQLYSNIPRTTTAFEERRDGTLRVRETVTALNDEQQTLVKTRREWDARGEKLGTVTRTTKTLADGTKQTTVAIEGMNQAMRGGATFSDQFVRHMKWIAQGIVLWAGINAVTSAITEWWMVQRELNQALAEFEMRTQAGPGQLENFRQSIMRASQATGVAPTQLAPVAPVAPDETTLRYAAELQRVAGGDMQNQMQWLIAQQRQFGQEGANTVNILNAMASGWRLTTLPMSQFITMLRDAAPLAEEFNLSMEEMYSVFGALQSVTGAEGKELDYLVRRMSKLYDPAVQQQLDIQTTRVLPTGDVERRNLVAVLDEVNQKIEDGTINLQEFAALFGATGRGQNQQAQQLMLAWDSFIGNMQKSMDTPAEWSSMFDIAMDTPIAKMDALTAAWQRFLAAFADETPITSAISLITESLDGLSNLMTGDIYRIISEQGGIVPWLLGQNFTPSAEGIIGAGAFSPSGTGIIGAGIGLPAGPGGEPYAPGGGEFEGERELPRWPSQAVIPEGANLDEVIRSMNQWVEAFSAIGDEYATWIADNAEMVMVYDENTRHLQMMNVFLPALQRAISENTQAQKARELQPGLRNVDMDLSAQGGMLTQWVQYYTQYLNRMGYPQEQRPQLVMGANDTFLRLWASNEALMLAIRALTEATEDQTDVLSGQWNVPEGTSMWVPIQSLFYSRGQGGGGTPDMPVGPPPSTLPSQQPDWMSLPGAVENMSVANMTVTNLEGLTVDIPKAGEEEGGIAEAISSMTEQQRILLDAITAFRERHGGVGAPEPDWDRWAQALSQAITSFRERHGGVGSPEPQWAGMDLAELMSQISITPSEIKTSSLEVQTPVADLITPSMKATSASTDIISPVTDVVAAQANILAASLTGLPEPDFSGIESALQTMGGTLQLILTAISNINIPTPAAPPPPAPPGALIPGAPTPNDIARFNAEQSYWNFTNYSRMRSAF